ncbi:MAG: methyltransferase domain-containing protein [Verrucomicrobiota bacterium]|nr:methyltransferase domain-containing protein [Verrucomicrobiota bacterium]
MHRVLTPELLDTLSPETPEARRSRRDLRYINAIMGNERWYRQVLPPLVRQGERVLELGAGDGELCARLRCEIPNMDGIDRCPAPANWPAQARWHQVNLLAFHGWGDYPVVIGNLIFHHFDKSALGVIGESLRPHTRVLVACEPARYRRYQRLFALLCVCMRASPVTRHDGHVSIAAGFQVDELPELLGLDPDIWRWRTLAARFGAYRLIAERRG